MTKDNDSEIMNCVCDCHMVSYVRAGTVCGGYHEYIQGCSVHLTAIMSTLGGIMIMCGH